MSRLSMSIPHQLDKSVAISRLQQLLANLKEQQKDLITNVKEEWNGNRGMFAFSAKGFDLSGEITVQDNSVDIEADLPFAVSLFSGTIKSIIENKAKELLS